MAALLACLCLALAAQDEDEAPRGVVKNEPGVSPGHTLISPFSTESTFLIDHEGRVVHRWDTLCAPGLMPYLLPDGNLLRGVQIDIPSRFEGGGKSGGLQEYTWDGELVWEFHFASDRYYYHHDIAPLPDGNLLLIAWEAKTAEEAIARGRDPGHVGEPGFWPGFVVEIEPLRPYGARVVWEWHSWDHLIQDYDSTQAGHGPVSEHPGRIDINAGAEIDVTADERRRLEQLGYVDDGAEDVDEDTQRDRERADWLHLNGIDYNAELDQIVLSSAHLGEVWIIDHSTTTAEAATRSGGRHGRGGDLLYRWGNPANWKAGSEEDRRLFYQHNPEWIPAGRPGAGDLTVFNNGQERSGDEEYSTVLQLTLPLDENGCYAREEDEVFGPEEPTWIYDPEGDERFYARFISGCQRLENGNTLICSGPQGRLLEVSMEGEVLWEFENPYGDAKSKSYSMFRAQRIEPDHPGLSGRSLSPLDPQPKTAAEVLAELPEAGQEASGWVDLYSEEAGLSEWVNVNCAPRQTFSVRPDPDDESEHILHCTGVPTGILRSQRMYENFIVEFEWRHMEEPSNAGFFVWADALPAVGGPFTRGVEVQVCNLGNGDWFTSHGDLFPIWGARMTPDSRFRISGSRSMPREEDFHVRPTGEWNHYRITALDGSLQLEVNGELVTAGSHCSPSRGYLCIESEGGEIHFRGLRVWELPAGSHAATEADTATEARPFHTLYNGLDFDGWKGREGEWEAADWQLKCSSGPAQLILPASDDYHELFLDFQRTRQPDGALLPLRIGELRFSAGGEQVGQWNRVRIHRSGSELRVQFAGQEWAHDLEAGDDGVVVLCNDGAATSYCSLFEDG